MATYSPFSSSSDKVSDEDNHPERLHWWERAPEEPPRKRERRGRRTAPDYDSDSPYQSDGTFIHNPDPYEVNRIANLSAAAIERYWAKQERLEAAELAREERRAAAREQRAAARRIAQIEERAAARARVDARAASEKAQMAERAAEWREAAAASAAAPAV